MYHAELKKNVNVQGVDTCKGDGGSPLTCKIQGRNSWVQVSLLFFISSPDYITIFCKLSSEANVEQAGIVSWGIGCGEEGVPAVYANVAHVVCWIDNEVVIDTSVQHWVA